MKVRGQRSDLRHDAFILRNLRVWAERSPYFGTDLRGSSYPCQSLTRSLESRRPTVGLKALPSVCCELELQPQHQEAPEVQPDVRGGVLVGSKKGSREREHRRDRPIPMTAAPMASTPNRMYPTAEIKSSFTAAGYPSPFPASFATSTNTLTAFFSSVRRRIISS